MTRAQQATVQAPTRPTWRPTWWMLLAAMTALAALYTYSEGRYLAIPLMCLPIMISYVAPYRLTRRGPVAWIIRGCLIMILLLLAPDTKQSRGMWYLDEGMTSLLGMLATAELMLQHWLSGPPRQGPMLVLCGAIFAAATNTPEPGLLVYLAPLFALAAIGSIRVFAPQRQEAATTAPVRRGMKGRIFKVAAVALALGMGLGTADSIQRLRDRLSKLGLEWFMRAPRMTVGMSSSDQLSRRFNLTPSVARALRITGTRTLMHLRGMVFDTYTNGGWRPRLEQTQRVMERSPAILAPPRDAKLFHVERIEDNLGLLYLPLNMAGLAPPPDSRTDVERGHRTVVTCLMNSGEDCIYGVAPGPTPDYQGPLCRKLTDAERESCLAIPPEIDPAVRALAMPLKQKEPLQSRVMVVAYLQANHEYSLESKLGNGDPVSDFLLNKRAAHCQYFASSAVILLRYCGVPARYVTGYYAHEPSGDNGLVVRQRDAHAWAEAWIDGIGWITVDATPAGGRPGDRTGEQGVSWWQRLRESATDLFSSISGWLRRLNWQQIALTGGLIALMAMIVQSILAARKKTRPAPAAPYSFPDDSFQTIAREFNQWLGRVGEAPLDSATWLEHLASQVEQTSSRRQTRRARLAAAREFVAAYNRTRFGDPTDAAAIAHLRQLFEKMKET